MIFTLQNQQAQMDNFQFDLEESINHILDDDQKQKFFTFPESFPSENSEDVDEPINEIFESKENSLSECLEEASTSKNEEVKSPTKAKNKLKNENLQDRKRDFKKNICGYIIRKCIREFTMPIFKEKVQKMCQVVGCSYLKVKNFYLGKLQRVTGPSHIPDLLIPNNEQQRRIKKIFGEFALWFLRERYLRYLLTQGKMQVKQAYIEYKNKKLTQLIEDIMYSVQAKIQGEEGE